MDYFKGLNAREQYDNEMMQHVRRQTELLEQIAQLLQGRTTKEEPKDKRSYTRREK